MKNRPKLRFAIVAAIACAAALQSSCVVAAPIKVVKTGAKAGIAAGKAGAKTAKAVVDVVTPAGKDAD